MRVLQTDDYWDFLRKQVARLGFTKTECGRETESERARRHSCVNLYGGSVIRMPGRGLLWRCVFQLRAVCECEDAL